MLTLTQIIALMVLLHMFADYTLQGWLASGKQKSWWENEVGKTGKSLSETKYAYDYDYLMALFCHSLYWSLLVFIPFFLHTWFIPVVLANTGIHMYVDDLKANRLKINLIEDQLAHFIQIFLTALIVF